MIRTIAYIRKSLIDYYDTNEIESFINIIFNNIYNYSKKEMILNASKKLAEDEFLKIKNIVDQLEQYIPIQYILGSTYFYNLSFNVTPNVLIPRPETEELVDLILKKYSNQKLNVLDIGTGSGCIPITLKKENVFFEMHACDISEKALDVAIKNASNNNTEVNFFKYDALSDKLPKQNDLDIIISNPPYVTEKEKEQMESNVLDNEPHLALFVPNNDPLLFYKAITYKAKKLLKVNGELYFEINEAYGKEMEELLQQNNFEAKIIKDLNGKDRIAFGKLKA
jgi:release factor glutamine methyltransferase